MPSSDTTVETISLGIPGIDNKLRPQGIVFGSVVSLQIPSGSIAPKMLAQFVNAQEKTVYYYSLVRPSEYVKVELYAADAEETDVSIRGPTTCKTLADLRANINENEFQPGDVIVIDPIDTIEVQVDQESYHEFLLEIAALAKTRDIIVVLRSGYPRDGNRRNDCRKLREMMSHTVLRITEFLEDDINYRLLVFDRLHPWQSLQNHMSSDVEAFSDVHTGAVSIKTGDNISVGRL